MRRILVLSALLLLVVPATATASSGAPGDGTLSIKNGNGELVSFNIRGAIIGRFTTGVLQVDFAKDFDCGTLDVWNTTIERERAIRDELGEVVAMRCIFSGTNVRFRFVGGRQVVRILRAKDVDVSAVGVGSVVLDGAGGDDGTFAFDNAAAASLPDAPRRFAMGVALPALP